MPYFCRSVISQALNHGAQKSLRGSKILVLGVAYKADIDDVRESPAEKIVELLRNAGADVAYHDPHVPELRRLALGAARAGGLRLRRDRHRALVDRLRRGRSPRQRDRRLPQRHEGPRSGRQGLEAVTRVGVAGLGYWGPNLARNFDELAELAWICDADGRTPDGCSRARYPQARPHRRLRRDARRRDRSTPSSSPRRSRPTTTSPAAPSLRASTSSSRSRRRCGPRRWTSSSRSPATATSC